MSSRALDSVVFEILSHRVASRFAYLRSCYEADLAVSEIVCVSKIRELKYELPHEGFRVLDAFCGYDGLYVVAGLEGTELGHRFVEVVVSRIPYSVLRELCKKLAE